MPPRPRPRAAPGDNVSLRGRGTAAGLIASALALPCAHAWAQETYPAQALELVVPFGVGGGADQFARKMSQLIEPGLGVPLYVSNIPGASGNAGLTKLLNNPPDGYTLATLTS